MTGLEPRKAYTLALAADAAGNAPLEPLGNFKTSPAGAAIVNAVGPIRQVVQPTAAAPRRILVIAPVAGSEIGASVQVQKQSGAR